MTDRMAMIAFVVILTIVIAVADMNWPAHMGGSETGLINSILNLI